MDEQIENNLKKQSNIKLTDDEKRRLDVLLEAETKLKEITKKYGQDYAEIKPRIPRKSKGKMK